MRFEVLENEGADEGVEGAVLLSFACGRVYGGVQVGLADLLLETRLVVRKEVGLLLFLWVLENGLDGGFGIVRCLGGFQFLVKVDEFGGETVGFRKMLILRSSSPCGGFFLQSRGWRTA